MAIHIKHEKCWAKTTPNGHPGISIEQHCRTAGIVAGLLASQAPCWVKDTLNVHIGIILAALHDVGKVSPGFQKKCSVWLKRFGLTAAEFAGTEEDHAKVSQKTAQDFLTEDNWRFWAAIVGAHHGKLKGDRLSSLCDGGEAWAAERRRLVETLVREFGPLPDQPPPNFNCGALWFNAGLIAVADWLASDENTFPPSKELDATTIRERAERQLARIGFQPISCPAGKTFADLFPSTPTPYPLQTLMAQAVRHPGVYVVEAAMGCGKTEAALIAAYNLLASGQATGIYFALPTQVTSNRIHKRVAAFIEQLAPGAGTRLIHGNSWLVESAQPLTDSRNGDTTKVRTGRDWFASPRRALLAPFGVGTVDQALLGVVAVKHFFVRQFGLAGKVVILDEVHSYDLYTGTLLDQLVTRLRELGATVIILSATLTAARRRKLLGQTGADTNALDSAYPLISASVISKPLPVTPDPPKTIQIRFKTAAKLIDAALESAQRGQCVLWIRNTVNDAQETYRQLCGQNRVGGPEIALLHARFPQFRREQLENDWLERLGKDQTKRPTNGCVLVSTQIAEQSVDIDADLLITDLSPTDMLLQRLGRLWRHPRPRPVGCNTPKTWIASPALDACGLRTATAAEIKAAFGKSAKVYAPYVLLRTFDLWRERTTLTLPADIRPILEATYTEPPEDEPSAWRDLRKELETRKEKLRHAAIANSNPWQVALDDEEGVQTRWNSLPTASVLLMRKVFAWDKRTGARMELLHGEHCNLSGGVFDHAAAQAIHRNLVKVPRWCVMRHIDSTPAWLREYDRGGILACKLCDEKLVLLPDGAESGLTYRNDLGVVIPPWQAGTADLRRHAKEDDDESYD